VVSFRSLFPPTSPASVVACGGDVGATGIVKDEKMTPLNLVGAGRSRRVPRGADRRRGAGGACGRYVEV